MKTMIQLEEVDLNFLQVIWQNILDVIPKILLALGLIVVAWIILKITLFIVKKLLRVTKIDSLTTKLNEAELFGKNDYTVVPSVIILKFIKYLLILIFVIIASEMLGLKMIDYRALPKRFYRHTLGDSKTGSRLLTTSLSDEHVLPLTQTIESIIYLTEMTPLAYT